MLTEIEHHNLPHVDAHTQTQPHTLAHLFTSHCYTPRSTPHHKSVTHACSHIQSMRVCKSAQSTHTRTHTHSLSANDRINIPACVSRLNARPQSLGGVKKHVYTCWLQRRPSDCAKE